MLNNAMAPPLLGLPVSCIGIIMKLTSWPDQLPDQLVFLRYSCQGCGPAGHWDRGSGSVQQLSQKGTCCHTSMLQQADLWCCWLRWEFFYQISSEMLGSAPRLTATSQDRPATPMSTRLPAILAMMWDAEIDGNSSLDAAPGRAEHLSFAAATQLAYSLQPPWLRK